MGIFFDKSGDMVPPVYQEFLRKFEAQQEVHVFLHLRALSKPYVSAEEMYTVTRTSLHNCYRMVIRHGYNDRVITADLGRTVYEELRKGIIDTEHVSAHASAISSSRSQTESAIESEVTPPQRVATASSAKNGTSGAIKEPSLDSRIAAVDSAYRRQVVYIVGKEQLRILSEKNSLLKRMVLGMFVWLRENTRAKIAQMQIPVEKLVEVGFVKEL
jgi:KUP system potassium uptake protein